MKLRPLRDHVIIQAMGQEEKTKGGIVLPDTASKERPEQGKVVATGPGRVNTKGQRIPMEVKRGDLVLFSKYGPNEVKVDDKEYLVAKEDDILAILEDK
jgi:chaperonin GroES